MKNKTTLLNQKRKKTTLLHYAMGSKTDDNSESSIRNSLGRNKEKEQTSKVVK